MQLLIDELNRVKWMLSDEERRKVNTVLDEVMRLVSEGVRP